MTAVYAIMLFGLETNASKQSSSLFAVESGLPRRLGTVTFTGFVPSLFAFMFLRRFDIVDLFCQYCTQSKPGNAAT